MLDHSCFYFFIKLKSVIIYLDSIVFLKDSYIVFFFSDHWSSLPWPPVCHAAMSSTLWSQEKPSGGFREDWRFYMVMKECTVEKPAQKTLRIPRGSLGQACQERNSLGRSLPPCKGKKSLRILDQTNVVLSLDERDVQELDEKLAELLFPITNCEERYALLYDTLRLERVRDIDCGSKVRVQLRSGDKPLPGVVRFKGSLLPDRALSGIWFGVELLVRTLL